MKWSKWKNVRLIISSGDGIAFIVSRNMKRFDDRRKTWGIQRRRDPWGGWVLRMGWFNFFFCPRLWFCSQTAWGK